MLEGYHNQMAWWVAMNDRHKEDGEREYPPVADALEAAGICPIKEYIQRIQATIVNQVS